MDGISIYSENWVLQGLFQPCVSVFLHILYYLLTINYYFRPMNTVSILPIGSSGNYFNLVIIFYTGVSSENKHKEMSIYFHEHILLFFTLTRQSTGSRVLTDWRVPLTRSRKQERLIILPPKIDGGCGSSHIHTGSQIRVGETPVSCGVGHPVVPGFSELYRVQGSDLSEGWRLHWGLRRPP